MHLATRERFGHLTANDCASISVETKQVVFMNEVTMSEPVRINLGAGHQRVPGWIAYDRSRIPLLLGNRPLQGALSIAERLGSSCAKRVLRWPSDVRTHDLTRGIPHKTDSVDAIYTSHMLEHLEPDAARFVLGECHRVLHHGGTLRIVVPDLKVITQAYLEGDRERLPSDTAAIADAFLESLYFRPPPNAGLGRRAIQRVLRSDDGGHKWMYDADSLMLRLREAGFTDAQRVPFREGRNREVAELDTRSPFHLHVEAFKGT